MKRLSALSLKLGIGLLFLSLFYCRCGEKSSSGGTGENGHLQSESDDLLLPDSLLMLPAMSALKSTYPEIHRYRYGDAFGKEMLPPMYLYKEPLDFGIPHSEREIIELRPTTKLPGSYLVE